MPDVAVYRPPQTAEEALAAMRKTRGSHTSTPPEESEYVTRWWRENVLDYLKRLSSSAGASENSEKSAPREEIPQHFPPQRS